MPQRLLPPSEWIRLNSLSTQEVDCATAVMLKILDGKCKMSQEEKLIMAGLYQEVRHLPGARLPAEMHTLIAATPTPVDEALRLFIYEQRVLAETMISRPVMKAFKARLRETQLLAPLDTASE